MRFIAKFRATPIGMGVRTRPLFQQVLTRKILRHILLPLRRNYAGFQKFQMEVRWDHLGLLCGDRIPLRTKSPGNPTHATEKVKLHACCGDREFCHRSGPHERCESSSDETPDGSAGRTVRLE